MENKEKTKLESHVEEAQFDEYWEHNTFHIRKIADY